MDMVEKVARALEASDAAEPFFACACLGKESASDFACPCKMWAARRRARAALEAMREPSDDMILAGSKYYHDNWRVDHAREDTNAERIWQAMIDAALTPTR